MPRLRRGRIELPLKLVPPGSPRRRIDKSPFFRKTTSAQPDANHKFSDARCLTELPTEKESDFSFVEGPSCLNKHSKISTTFSGKRPVVLPNSTTPSRLLGCCF